MNKLVAFGSLRNGTDFQDTAGFKYTKINDTEARHNAAKPLSEPKGPMQYDFDADDLVTPSQMEPETTQQ